MIARMPRLLPVRGFRHGAGGLGDGRGRQPAHNPVYPFSDYFWSWKGSHDMVFTILGDECPAADVYHAVSTGYAGLAGVVAKMRTGRPFLLTEHGLYHKEREMEIKRAPFVKGYQRDMWIAMYNGISRLCYRSADVVVSLFEYNRRRQIEMGADQDAAIVIPNGIDIPRFTSIVRKKTGRVPRRARGPGGAHQGHQDLHPDGKDRGRCRARMRASGASARRRGPRLFRGLPRPRGEPPACRPFHVHRQGGRAALLRVPGRAPAHERARGAAAGDPRGLRRGPSRGLHEVGNVPELLDYDERFLASSKDAEKLAQAVRYVHDHPAEIEALCRKNSRRWPGSTTRPRSSSGTVESIRQLARKAE